MTRCRAKNPAACRSPRCPDRRYGAAFFSRIERGERPQHAALLATDRHESKALAARVTADQREALEAYTNQDYTDLNAALRRKEPLTSEQERMVEHLDTVLSEHNDGKVRQVYRSMSRPHDINMDTLSWAQKTFPQNKVVRFAGYTSTSRSLTSVAAMLRAKPAALKKSFFVSQEEHEEMIKEETSRNMVLEIVTPDGAPVSSFSHMPQETEMLMPRNKEYRVFSVEETTYSTNEDILSGDEIATREYPAVRVRLVDVMLER